MLRYKRPPILKDIIVKVSDICQITVSGQIQQPELSACCRNYCSNPKFCGPSVQTALSSAQKWDVTCLELTFLIRTVTALLVNSATPILSNLMQKISQNFEAQYQPYLAKESIFNNLWKWQAEYVGKDSKTHFSSVPTILVTRGPNKGWKVLPYFSVNPAGLGKEEEEREGRAC